MNSGVIPPNSGIRAITPACIPTSLPAILLPASPLGSSILVFSILPAYSLQTLLKSKYMCATVPFQPGDASPLLY